jgi:hypothetical protein
MPSKPTNFYALFKCFPHHARLSFRLQHYLLIIDELIPIHFLHSNLSTQFEN